MNRMILVLFASIISAFGMTNSVGADEAKKLRLGHFPNITHGQAVYAQFTGEFEKAIGVPIKWITFKSGPSAMEALTTGAIDATFVGPGPAINGFVKTHGEIFRVVAGSASGGAALVVRTDSGIATDKDFNDKIVATPQLGNTQDMAARIWFKEKGYQLRERGGRLTILPLSNPDQLFLFQKKEIDAAWAPEPWASRLEIEGGGKLFLDEKTLWPDGKFVTTHLVVGRNFLEKNPGLVKKLIASLVEVTQKLNADKKAAAKILNAELKKETGKEMSDAVIQSALNRVEFTWDPIRQSLFKSAQDAKKIGFLRELPSMEPIYDLTLLNEVLKEKGLPPVK